MSNRRAELEAELAQILAARNARILVLRSEGKSYDSIAMQLAREDFLPAITSEQVRRIVQKADDA